MKKIKKRMVSILLTMVMAMTLFFAAPMTVFAAGEYEINGTPYDSLQAAISAANSGDTITLTTDFTDTATTTVTISGKQIFLDLGSYTLNLDSTGVASAPAILIQYGSLTVQGSGGTLNITAATDGQAINLYSNPPSNLSLSTLTVASGATVTTAGLIGINANGANSTVNCSGTINATGTLYGVNVQNGSQATVSSATATGSGSDGVWAYGTGSTITVNGNVTGNGTDSVGAVASAGGEVIVNGNVVVNSTGYSYGVSAFGGGQVYVNGNVTVTDTGGTSVGALTDTGGQITVTGNVNVTGTSYCTGVYANGNNSSIIVNGSVSASGSDCTGAFSGNGTGSQVTIDGSITVPAGEIYIMIDGIVKLPTDFANVTTKAGYLTYTDGSNTVWVKGPTTATHPVKQDFGEWTGSGTSVGIVGYPTAAPLNDFLRLALNGVTIPASNYIAVFGSTVITLDEAYLKTLANATYTVRAIYTNGAYADLTLIVNNPNAPGAGSGANGVPQTNDINNTLGWTMVLAFVILGIFGLMAWRRRQGAQE